MNGRPHDWEEQDHIEHQVAALRDQLNDSKLQTWLDSDQTVQAGSNSDIGVAQKAQTTVLRPNTRLWAHWPNWRKPGH